MKQYNYTPLRDALSLAGHGATVDGRMLYQDYLNIVAGTGTPHIPPITEEQWEMMCDMLGNDRPLYASTVSQILKNMKFKKSHEVF